jgi:hypothetical protein
VAIKVKIPKISGGQGVRRLAPEPVLRAALMAFVLLAVWFNVAVYRF